MDEIWKQPRLRPSSCYCFCCWGWAQKLVCRRAVAVRLSLIMVWWQQELPDLWLQQLSFVVLPANPPPLLRIVWGTNLPPWIPFCLKSWVTIACSQPWLVQKKWYQKKKLRFLESLLNARQIESQWDGQFVQGNKASKQQGQFLNVSPSAKLVGKGQKLQ